jgi:hypothetical protein
MLLGSPLKGKWPLSHVMGLLLLGRAVVLEVDVVDDAVVVESWSRMSSTLLLLLVSRSSSPVYS